MKKFWLKICFYLFLYTTLRWFLLAKHGPTLFHSQQFKIVGVRALQQQHFFTVRSINCWPKSFVPTIGEKVYCKGGQWGLLQTSTEKASVSRYGRIWCFRTFSLFPFTTRSKGIFNYRCDSYLFHYMGTCPRSKGFLSTGTQQCSGVDLRQKSAGSIKLPSRIKLSNKKMFTVSTWHLLFFLSLCIITQCELLTSRSGFICSINGMMDGEFSDYEVQLFIESALTILDTQSLLSYWFMEHELLILACGW